MEIPNNYSLQESVPTQDSGQGSNLGVNGMRAIIAAIAANLPALQNNSNELMSLSASIEKINEQVTSYWLNAMSGPGPDSVQSRINAEENSSDDPKTKAAKINKLNVEFQTDSTEYNNASTSYVGLDNGVNNSAATVSQTMSIDVTLVNQALISAQNLARLLA